MTPEEQRAADVARVELEIRRAEVRIECGVSAEDEGASAADRFYGTLDRESGERDVPFYRRILAALTTAQEPDDFWLTNVGIVIGEWRGRLAVERGLRIGLALVGKMLDEVRDAAKADHHRRATAPQGQPSTDAGAKP